MSILRGKSATREQEGLRAEFAGLQAHAHALLRQVRAWRIDVRRFRRGRQAPQGTASDETRLAPTDAAPKPPGEEPDHSAGP